MNDATGHRMDEDGPAAEHNGTEPPKIESDWPQLDPSRWWFASSAFPMIAGTLGPVASAFSICALVRPWRQYFPPGIDVETAPFISDPPWLTVINAVQLAVAIVANVALLLNMARRLTFSIAQPVTIVGWYISSLCLIALTATASGPLDIGPADEFIWSQAYYYAIFSAALYFLIASLMVVTYIGAQIGRYPKDFMLTPSQRTLMLQTIMFLLYLLLGALLFGKIEEWSYLDAVYWAAVTLFTVGFGDYVPSTTLGRALLLPYSLIGIISLGLVIGSIRSLVLDRGRRRLNARIMEKRRRKTLRRLTLKGKDDILIPVTNQQTGADSSGLTEFERREREFKLMRKIQERAARRRRWLAMTISTSSWLILWLVGAGIFMECEKRYQGWTYFDAFYFAFVSLTTVGYGDITPVSNAAKSFWVFWALLAVPTTTVMISNAGDTIVKGIRDATDQVATVTILPGERGFKKDLKRLLRSASCGILFEEEIDESPPGFHGDVRRPRHEGDDEDDNDDHDNDANDVEETMAQDQADLEAEGAATETAKQKRAQREKDEEDHAKRVEAHGAEEATRNRRATSSVSSQQAVRPASSPRQNLPISIPTTKEDYHITLIDEIGRVAQHLKHHPPRKYTFQEWAWYLKLIGEDEADAEQHRKANPHLRRHEKEQLRDGVGSGGQGGPNGEHLPWSWVGSRSPLLGSQEEAEWILERLIARLGEELREGRRAEGKVGEG
ncbi:hypothetical protein VTK56DRAFT_10011 [Thermocarpiscus australiensis]